jgi:hypothetical protein
MLDFGLYFFYFLLGVAVLSALVFPIINAIKTPKALLRSLAGVLILLVLFGIAYMLSSDEVSAKNAVFVTSSGSRMISAGLILFYITLILSAVLVVYSEITKAFK